MFTYLKNLWATDVGKITASLAKVHNDLDNYMNKVRNEIDSINIRKDFLDKEHSLATTVKTNLAQLLGRL